MDDQGIKKAEAMQLADIPTYELDRAGDVTLIVANVPQDMPRTLEDLKPDMLAGLTSPPATSSPAAEVIKKQPLHIRASSKHLTLACSYFANMLDSDFNKGACLRENGHVKLQIDHPNGLAFLVLMLIIHGRPRYVPQKLSRRTLADVAVLVDYYQCHDAVELLSGIWIENIPGIIHTGCTGYLDWVIISWVFARDSAFKEATGYLIMLSDSTISAPGLPLPGNILEHMNKHRLDTLQGLVDSLHEVHKKCATGCLKALSTANNTPEICSCDSYYASHSIYGRDYDLNPNGNDICTYTVLGSLTKSMMEMSLLTPKPEPPFEHVNNNSLKKTVRKHGISTDWYHARTKRCPYLLPSVQSCQGDVSALQLPAGPSAIHV
ncbi:hypothetical protein BJX64DRAFT_286008 [Aspergillus heterothallicus]